MAQPEAVQPVSNASSGGTNTGAIEAANAAAFNNAQQAALSNAASEDASKMKIQTLADFKNAAPELYAAWEKYWVQNFCKQQQRVSDRVVAEMKRQRQLNS